MRYPSPTDIAEMKARGYEQVSIEKAQSKYERGLIAKEISSAIRSAFHGVKLGNGVGLHEARAMDDYAEPEIAVAQREKDEKENWESIPDSSLRAFRSSLEFCDAEGTRFHLPAYLIADLEVETDYQGVESLLMGQSKLGPSRFSLLNREQRMAVRSYLLLLAKDPDLLLEHDDIRDALETYWTDEPSTGPSNVE